MSSTTAWEMPSQTDLLDILELEAKKVALRNKINAWGGWTGQDKTQYSFSRKTLDDKEVSLL